MNKFTEIAPATYIKHTMKPEEIIEVEVLSELFPRWGTVRLAKSSIIGAIVHSQFLRRFPDFEHKFIGNIYAIKFKSGALFDCLMAQHPDKEIRRRCWR